MTDSRFERVGARLGTAPRDVLEALLASSADAVYLVDVDGRVEFANPAALDLLGYDEDELLGRVSHPTIHHHHWDGTPFPQDECPMLAPRTTGETVRAYGDTFWRKDGSKFRVAYSSAPLPTSRGRGAVVVFRDVTRQMEDEEAARNEAVERARAEEIHASRARIVAAADAERRRLVRDLHDGAQQRLVRILLGLRLARDALGETAAARGAGAGAGAGSVRGGGDAGDVGDGGDAGRAGDGGAAGRVGDGGAAGRVGDGGAAGRAGDGGAAGRAGDGGAAGRVGDGGAAGRVGDGGELARVRAEVGDLLEQAFAETRAAIAELRDLGSGIHPQILTNRGVAAAVESLTAPLPLAVDLRIPADRYPPTIEAAAYFVIAEALTNVIKHGGASAALVMVAEADGELVIEVSDDGCGGARIGATGGLAGLQDRVAALSGSLTLLTAAPTGTLLRAVLPAMAGLGAGPAAGGAE